MGDDRATQVQDEIAELRMIMSLTADDPDPFGWRSINAALRGYRRQVDRLEAELRDLESGRRGPAASPATSPPADRPSC